MSDYEEEVEAGNNSMVTQLGTDPKTLARGEIDKIKLTYLVPSDRIPNQFKPMLYFLVRNDVVNRGIDFDKSVIDNTLRLLNAINGRGQDMLIKAENAMKGLPVHVEPPPERPSIMDRILDRENVAEYERWKERKELGME